MSTHQTLTSRTHLSSSILLWMRTDRSREAGMNHWKGPHSGIISATPGLEEYRQIHLAELNPGRWPATVGIETAIPVERKIDGVAEVTFESVLSPARGRAQTKLAFQDEVNVFRRTLLYAGMPRSSRWYDIAGQPEVGSRALIYLRRRRKVGGRRFRRVVSHDLVAALAASGDLTELRTQTFLPWVKKTWDTPHVAHDNPSDQRFHASVILGFEDDRARDAFLSGPAAERLSVLLAPFVSAIHAYDVSTVLTFVKDGEVLANPR